MNEAKYRAAERRLWESVGVQPEERFVTLPRLGVKVRVQEVGTGEPALFIHGGPNSGSTWAPMIEHMAGYRCLIVDRPGTGLSEPYPVDRTTLPVYGSQLVGDVLDAVGLDSSHVVASSMGGYLALQSAAGEPSRLRRMVQMAAPALAPGSLTPPFMRAMSLGLVRRILGVLPPNQRANDSIMRQIGHGATLDAGGFSSVFDDWYLALQQHTDTMENDGNLIGSLVSVRGFDPALAISDEVLGAVKTPTLFLWGADDGFGREDVARDVVGRMSNAALVMMPDSGHLPWLDDPRYTAHATTAFLDSDDPIARVPATLESAR